MCEVGGAAHDVPLSEHSNLAPLAVRHGEVATYHPDDEVWRPTADGSRLRDRELGLGDVVELLHGHRRDVATRRAGVSEASGLPLAALLGRPGPAQGRRP